MVTKVKYFVKLLLVVYTTSNFFNVFASAEIVDNSFVDSSNDSHIEERLDRIERLLNSELMLEIKTSISDLRHEIQELRGRIEVLEHSPQVQHNKPSSEEQSDIPVSDANSSSNDEYTLYRKSYALIKEKDYVEAEKQLQNYLQNYPDGKYTVNAYYWLGEVNLIQSNYNLAVNYYDDVIKKYPHDQKASTAMFKKGMAYLYLHDINHAKEVFTDVIAKNPNTSISKLAESRLTQIEEEFH